MFEAYEKRERARQVTELREVCPDISAEEAEAALRLCDNREEEAAAQLVSNPDFVRRVKAACGGAPVPAPAPRRAANGTARPTGPRAKIVDPKRLGD